MYGVVGAATGAVGGTVLGGVGAVTTGAADPGARAVLWGGADGCAGRAVRSELTAGVPTALDCADPTRGGVMLDAEAVAIATTTVAVAALDEITEEALGDTVAVAVEVASVGLAEASPRVTAHVPIPRTTTTNASTTANVDIRLGGGAARETVATSSGRSREGVDIRRVSRSREDLETGTRRIGAVIAPDDDDGGTWARGGRCGSA